MTFRDFVKKAVKYTSPVAFGADVVKDRAESYGKTWGASPNKSTSKVDATPVYDNVITVDPTGHEGGAYTGGYRTGGYRTGSGGTGRTVNPMDSLKSTVRDKFNILKSVFDGIYGDVDNLIKEKADALNKNYDSQLTDMNKSYERGVGQNSLIYGARGLGDSSYLGDAQGQLKDNYDRSVEDATNTRQAQLADLGRYGATTKAGFDAQRNTYQNAMNNLDSYDEAGLNALSGNLDNATTQAGVQRAGLGTQGQFINQLNSITPVQQQFSSNLATKLQNLITSSAPVYAKKQIAQGLIKASTLNDQNAQSQWTNYFENLLNGSA